MNKFWRGAVIGALAWVATEASQADTYPSKPVMIVVPTAPGGPTDAVARLTAERLGEVLGKSVVIQNVGGVGGILGTDQVAKAKPDGYTLALGINSLAIFPNVRSPSNPLPFNPERDLVAVGGIANSAHVLVVHPSLGVKTVAELVALAKSKPGELSYGSAGVGGTIHLPLALFAHRAGINVIHVPFKGAGPALLETVSGRISMSVPGYSGALDAFIKDGKLVPLAVTSAERLPFLPNVPTLAESGFPDMVFPIWYGLFAPKGTPPEVIALLSADLEKICAEPAFVAKLYAQGNVAKYAPPNALARTLSEDIKRLGERIRSSGIKFDDQQ